MVLDRSGFQEQQGYRVTSEAGTDEKPHFVAWSPLRLRWSSPIGRAQRLLWLAICCLLASCALEPAGSPPANDLRIEWQVLTDSSSREETFDSELILRNQSREILGSDWVIYFNYLGTILSDPAPAGVAFEHINGDFFKLRPEQGFRLERASEVKVRLRSTGKFVNYSQAPSGFYLVYLDGSGKETTPNPIESRVHQVPLGSPLHHPGAVSRYQQAEKLRILPPETVTPLIPTPVSLRRSPRAVRLDSRFQIRYQSGLEQEAKFLSNELEKLMGLKLRMAVGDKATHNTILLWTDRVRVGRPIRQAGDEAYGLLTSPAIGIQIVGTDRAGVFYGIQSLRALLPADTGVDLKEVVVPGIDIADVPRFPHRGLHLDVARNFQKPETIRKLLDLMAFYKLNLLHLHLSDDEGWRLQIPGLPELTEVGARRGHTLDGTDHLPPSFGSGPDPKASSGSGFFTRDEFIDLLRYAAKLHIQVLPEIDLPGHARAAVKSMEARRRKLVQENREAAEEFMLSDLQDKSSYVSVQRWSDNIVNVCRESTYHWLGAVVDELVKMYREADLELSTLHLGGDEVPEGAWKESPECQALFSSGIERAPETAAGLPQYFFSRATELLRERSIRLAVWQEAARTLLKTPEGKLDTDPKSAPKPIANLWHGAANPARLTELLLRDVPVVLSPADFLYFDMAYEPDPEEPGLRWAGFVDTRKTWLFPPLWRFRSQLQELAAALADTADKADLQQLRRAENEILGIQGQLWGELLKSPERLEYMAFPRLLSLAERAWSAEPAWQFTEDPEKRDLLLQEDWERFANALGQVELPRLDRWENGIAYRLPPPGAVVEDGLLKANSIFPGLTIRYSLNGTPLTADSPIYLEPVPISGSATLATFDTRGRSSRPVEIR